MKLATCLILVLAVNGRMALAEGVDSSGGGGAYVCRGSQGEVLNSELLDLWEAQKISKLVLNRSGDSVDLQIGKAIEKLEQYCPELAAKAESEISIIRKTAEALPADVALNPPTDALPPYGKPGCPLEGMMYFDGEEGKVQYSSEIFEALQSNTDKAATWVHEGIYKIFRDRFDHRESKKARKLVGCLFSESNCFGNRKSLADVLGENPSKYRCTDEANSIEYLIGFSQADDDTKYIYTKVGGRTLAYPAVYSTGWNKDYFESMIPVEGSARPREQNWMNPDAAPLYIPGMEKFGAHLSRVSGGQLKVGCTNKPTDGWSDCEGASFYWTARLSLPDIEHGEITCNRAK